MSESEQMRINSCLKEKCFVNQCSNAGLQTYLTI